MPTGIPKMRWNDVSHRWEYHIPVVCQPGNAGFVVLRKFDDHLSVGANKLSKTEQKELLHMEQINHDLNNLDLLVKLQHKIENMEHHRKGEDEKTNKKSAKYMQHVLVHGHAPKKMLQRQNSWSSSSPRQQMRRVQQPIHSHA